MNQNVTPTDTKVYSCNAPGLQLIGEKIFWQSIPLPRPHGKVDENDEFKICVVDLSKDA